MNYLPEAFNYLRRADKRFDFIIDELPEFTFEAPPLPYVGLMSSVASQQLSTKVAKVIWLRFLDLFEDKFPHAIIVKEMDKEVLRSIGFSYAKAQYVINIAEHFHEMNHSNENLVNLSDDELLKALTAIKGVGEWTVQMLQIFNLHKTDIWPIKDLGVQQGFAKMYQLDATDKDLPKKMTIIAEKWRPYRSAASLLLWKWKDSGFPNLAKVLAVKGM